MGWMTNSQGCICQMPLFTGAILTLGLVSGLKKAKKKLKKNKNEFFKSFDMEKNLILFCEE